MQRAQREPEGRFHSLAYVIDVSILRRAYRRMLQDGAVAWIRSRRSSTGRTWRKDSGYAHPEEGETFSRSADPACRHRNGREQGAAELESRRSRPSWSMPPLREALEAVSEQDFVDCSHSFRPGRGVHDAVRTLGGSFAEAN